MCSVNTTNSLPIMYQIHETGRSSSSPSTSPHVQHGMHSSIVTPLHIFLVCCLWSIRYRVTYTGLQVTCNHLATLESCVCYSQQLCCSGLFFCFFVRLFVRRTLWVPVHYDENWQVQSRQKPKLLKLWFLHIHILSLLMANNSAADSKGDERSQWEMPFSRCSSSETPEPIFKKLHSWLSRLPHLTYKHLDQSPQRRVCASVKLSPSGVYFLFFFVSCSSQKVRPLYR